MSRFIQPRSLRRGMGLALLITLAGKGIGYARQLVIAYNFGISRSLDIFVMAQSLTMLLVFNYTTWFDQLAIPHLVRAKESGDEQRFKQFSACLISFSVVAALLVAILFVALFPLVNWFLARGFMPSERVAVRSLSWYFIPWILLVFPYNALSAILKSMRYFDAVFAADFIVSLMSTGAFILWHPYLQALPLTLALGFAVALIPLVAILRHRTGWVGSPLSVTLRPMLKQCVELFVVNQSSFANTSIDRFYQSFLRPGSMSAYNYAIQSITPIYELLAFDDLYTVSLSSEEQRLQKLQRLLYGTLLLTVPLTFFIVMHASQIVGVLFEHGRFAEEARTLTAHVLQVGALTLIPGTLFTPMMRTLQISNRVSSGTYFTLGTAVLAAALNFIFVFKLKLDVLGITMTMVTANTSLVVFGLVYLRRVGLNIDLWRLFKYFAFALLLALVANVVANLIPFFHPRLFYLGTQAGVFGMLISLLYWPVRDNIRFILYG
jgi:putative peptidoglycan lipid II flippase